jgi:anti-anti-sigma factor
LFKLGGGGFVFRLATATHDTVDSLPGFRVGVEPEDDLVRVVPVGELDLASSGRLLEQLGELQDAGFQRLTLDLRQLEFIDCSGLHLILEADARARTEGQDFDLIPGSAKVQRLFELTGTDEQLRFLCP